MTHVNRWRTITATATTAVLAAGAFGISAATERSSPDAIAAEAGTTVPELVEDSDSTLERSVQSAGSAQTAAVAPASVESAEEAEIAEEAEDSLSGASTSQGAVTELILDDGPSASPDDGASVDDEDGASVEDEDGASVDDEDGLSVEDDEGSPDSAA